MIKLAWLRILVLHLSCFCCPVFSFTTRRYAASPTSLSQTPQGSEIDNNPHPHSSNMVVFLLPQDEENPTLTKSAHQMVQELSSSSLPSREQVTATVVHCGNDPQGLCATTRLLVALGITSPLDVRFAATCFRQRRTSQMGSQVAVGGKPFAPLVGRYDEANPSWWGLESIPWTTVARDKATWQDMQALMKEEGEVQEFCQAIWLFFDRVV